MLQLEYKGVHSTMEVVEDSLDGAQQKRYWLVWFASNETVMIQALDAQGTVSGKQYRLRIEDFTIRFTEEPDVLLQPQVLAHAHLVEHEARELPDEPYSFVLKDRNGGDVVPELMSSTEVLDIARQEAEEFERQSKTPQNVAKSLKSSFEEALAALESGESQMSNLKKKTDKTPLKCHYD